MYYLIVVLSEYFYSEGVGWFELCRVQNKVKYYTLLVSFLLRHLEDMAMCIILNIES